MLPASRRERHGLVELLRSAGRTLAQTVSGCRASVSSSRATSASCSKPPRTCFRASARSSTSSRRGALADTGHRHGHARAEAPPNVVESRVIRRPGSPSVSDLRPAEVRSAKLPRGEAMRRARRTIRAATRARRSPSTSTTPAVRSCRARMTSGGRLSSARPRSRRATCRSARCRTLSSSTTCSCSSSGGGSSQRGSTSTSSPSACPPTSIDGSIASTNGTTAGSSTCSTTRARRQGRDPRPSRCAQARGRPRGPRDRALPAAERR